jgi:hypothetical protein
VKHLRTFGRFWYDFIIGDDWRVAVGVTAAIAVAYLVAQDGANWWWLLPVCTAALLAVSVNNATRPRRR